MPAVLEARHNQISSILRDPTHFHRMGRMSLLIDRSEGVHVNNDKAYFGQVYTM